MVRDDVLVLQAGLCSKGRQMNDALIRLVLIVVSAITVLTGFIQCVAPSAILGLISNDAGAVSSHLFATVGMFMVVTGALFFKTLWARSPERAVPFWIGVQKAAAAVFVLIGVHNGVFVPLAFAFAVFDGATAALVFLFLYRFEQ